jgi:Nuclease-related domain
VRRTWKRFSCACAVEARGDPRVYRVRLRRSCGTRMSAQQQAGKSAGDHYKELARAWRRRFRLLFAGWLMAAITLLVLAFVVAGQWKVTMGLAAGILLGTYACLRGLPPARIQNWYWGSEGERKTGKELRRLPSSEWRVWHDLQWEDKSNIDHVVVGAAGVLLLDTKDCFGRISVDRAGLHFQWLEDPDMVSEYRGIFAKEGSASAALKQLIQNRAGVTLWVQAVVVLWGDFDQGPIEVDRVTFVRGSELVEWMRSSQPPRRAFDADKITGFLDQASREGLGPRPRTAATPLIP